MKWYAVIPLLAALGAAGAPATVTVQPSSLGFKQALAACPGALGAISLTLGHVRVAEAPGVDSDIDASNAGAQIITLSAATQTATVKVNAPKNTVTARHVTLASARRVACVGADTR